MQSALGSAITVVALAALGWVVLELDKRSGTVLSAPFRVVDGDSLRKGDRRLRLMGIDAPEIRQMCQRGGQPWRCGRDARTALRAFVRQPGTVCKTKGMDRYQRWLVECFVDRMSINAEMVRQGWAVDYSGYGREEAQARRARTGLWAGTFDTPQDWRRARRSDVAETTAVSWMDRARGVWAGLRQ
ncbi:MAG: thermonuclease family protein [Pseudomonadota bacterium]